MLLSSVWFLTFFIFDIILIFFFDDEVSVLKENENDAKLKMLKTRSRRLTNCLRMIANFREDFADDEKNVDSIAFFISSSSSSFSNEFIAEISCYTNVKTKKHLEEAEYKKAYRFFQNIENAL